MILSGTVVRDSIRGELAERVRGLSDVPELVIIQVGENPESNVYIQQKKKFGESIGVPVRHVVFPEDIQEESLLSTIIALNHDISVGGIIVQLPIPQHFHKRHILDAIIPTKDVDGLGTYQAGLLYTDSDNVLVPATAKGVMSLCDYYGIEFEGKKVAVIGRSELVGKPVAMLALRRHATVTLCHSRTKDLASITQAADIVIVAAGVRGLIGPEHIHTGQVVIDVGIHRTENGLCGDVQFDAVKDVVAAITPVPGGVGPLTVASLFQNFIEAVI